MCGCTVNLYLLPIEISDVLDRIKMWVFVVTCYSIFEVADWKCVVTGGGKCPWNLAC